MSVSIDTITVSSIEDRRMVLSNAQAARIISIGTDWSTLRIGIRYNITDSGADYVGANSFFLGALSSPVSDMSNGPLTMNCSHFVGFINSSNILRIAGPPDYYTINNTDHYGKKIGNTVTTATGTNQNHYIATGDGPRRSVTIVELVKGSPNFTIRELGPSPGGGPVDISQALFKTAMSAATMADAATVLTAAGGVGYTGTYTANLAVSEATNGYLNAICVAWSFIPVLNVSDIGWTKIA